MKNNLRKQLTHAAYQMLHLSGAARLARKSNAVVFCYHNIVPDALYRQVGDPYLHMALSTFAEQIDWIGRSFDVVPVSELVGRSNRGQSVAGLAALTFDDGYTGMVRHAIPLLRLAGLPFSVFPVVEFSTKPKPFWWDLFTSLSNEDRDRFLGELQGEYCAISAQSNPGPELPPDALPARWDELRAVMGPDCTIGVHSVTHRNLAVLSDRDITWELDHARTRLAQELGTTPSLVAYPYGRSDVRVHAATQHAGFAAGLGLSNETFTGSVNRFDIPRINVPANIAMANFACWSSGLRLRS